MGTTLLFICIILEPGRTFNLIITQSLKASGDVRFSALMAIIFPFLLGIPLAYLLCLRFHMGLTGLWWTMAIDEWCRAILLAIRWKSRVWEKKILVNNMESGLSIKG